MTVEFLYFRSTDEDEELTAALIRYTTFGWLDYTGKQTVLSLFVYDTAGKLFRLGNHGFSNGIIYGLPPY